MVFLNQCCCGLSLPMGTVIIGVFYLIGSVPPVAITGHYWNAGKNITISCRKNYTIIEKDDEKMWVQVQIREKLHGCNGCNILQAICAVFLILGASLEKPLMLIPWVIVQSLLVLVLCIICTMIATILLLRDECAVWGILLICAIIIYVFVSVYFLLVVCSYYQSLTEKEEYGVRGRV